ncbi:MAG: iron uptake porin [Chamaesiphon sp.]|nr:iron uptake porin [Chamaesiphon sp.]
MTNLLSKNFLSPIVFGMIVWVAGAYAAAAAPNGNGSTAVTQSVANPGASKVTNFVAAVSTEATAEQIEEATQATEIQPGSWAYQSLQALTAKYSCGNTPTGNKILSREEFATSLNGCVQSIEQLVAKKPRRAIKKRRPAAPSMVAPPAAPEIVAPPPAPAIIEPPAPVDAPEEAVSQQDLDRLKGLVQSFSAELQGVDSRLQATDAKVTKLQAQSFSTTTKLNGEAIIGISGYGGNGTAVGTNSRNTTILSNRVRLNFDTSFTGKDRLRTRLQSRNTPSFGSSVTGTNMTRLGYDGDEANTTNLSLLQYSFPLSSQTKVIVETTGSEFNENMPTFNPILASSGSGSISRFGRFNPVYRLSGDGAALTINHKFSDALDLAVGYAIPNGTNPAANNSQTNPVANPAAGSGLFNGSNAIISQLNFAPSKDLSLGLVYARAYSTNGVINAGTGSIAANTPFGGTPTTANHYSFMTSYKVSPNFILSGWAGFTEANRETGVTGNASTSNYAISLAFPDFGQKGNNLAFIVGIPPKLNSRTGTGLGAANAPTPSTTATIQGSPDTSYHIEALYRVKLSDNLAITPGILFITNPEHNRANPTEYVGTIRTTFNF